ncbi:phage shock protein PspA [Pseudoalteromonas sp. MMG024]|uniref:phage shock protein PspA n=1 Tax=Pseudoalteromonas sp. MMG024 TaxID=2909980 RepID=UPI001F21AF56|nr:phage shock protein PspA [Pseudoalteromonas sp. MMG024]MCF6458120.1 phage shock protein PspA [Pseudoalteromonas sp. MMG024]
MGIFTRLTDIIQANVSAALDRAEDPEKLVRLMVQEMEEALVELRTTSASLIAEKKTLQRKLTKQQSSADYWHAQAEKALQKEREDLAKAALAEKQKANKEIDGIQPEIDRIDEVLSKVAQDSNSLHQKLTQAKGKLKEYQIRSQSAEARVKAKSQLHSEQIDRALERFNEIEYKVDRIEAQIESYEVTQSSSLKTQFDELEKDDALDEELAALKAQVAKKAA